MRAVRLRILLVSLVISVGAFMPVGVAHADGTFAGACEFDALTWNTTPFQWLSNQGVFTFAGMANCAADVGGQSQVFPNVQLDASGVYNNIVCGGTSTWIGTLTLGGLGQSNFNITFVAGQGVVSGAFTGAGPLTGQVGPAPGYATLTPGPYNQSDPPIFSAIGGSDQCVTQFEIQGAFGIV